MTILGAYVDANARAIIWADTECVDLSGASAGHVNKLVVNAAAGLACVSGGWGHRCRLAAAIAADAATLDEALDKMPARLRAEAARCFRDGCDPREYGGQVTIIAGYSTRFGCVVAFEFTGAAYLAPVIVSQVTYPAVPDHLGLNTPADVVEMAREQATALRRCYPSIGCGRLSIAVVDRRSVTCSTPYDLAAGAWVEDARVSINQDPIEASSLVLAGVE